MTKRLILVILCLCCIGWLTLIFHLSTEDGKNGGYKYSHCRENIRCTLFVTDS